MFAIEQNKPLHFEKLKRRKKTAITGTTVSEAKRVRTKEWLKEIEKDLVVPENSNLTMGKIRTIMDLDNEKRDENGILTPIDLKEKLMKMEKDWEDSNFKDFSVETTYVFKNFQTNLNNLMDIEL